MIEEQLQLDAEDVKIMAARCASLLAEREAMEKEIGVHQDAIKQLKRRIKETGYLIEYAMQQIATAKLTQG